MDYPISLYYDVEISDVKTLDLCRGDDDYRKVYIVNDGNRKIVIKHLSNTFSDKTKIEGWFNLMDEYRKTGLYCPSIIMNRYGELLHRNTIDGRDYYTYAEEYSIYETAEHIAKVHNLDVEACDFIRETAWGTTEGEPLAHNGHPWYTAKDMVTEGLDILSPDWENEEPFCRNKILETAKVAWQGFDELLEKLGFKREGKYYRVCEENDKNYVVVSHGGASTAVISHLLNLPLPFFYKSVQLDFTSVTIIALKGDKGQLTSPKIELLNDSRHAEIIDIEWKY